MAKISAKALVRQHGIAVDHALYRETGDWFHILQAFPGALIDAGGFLRFASRAEYDDFIAKGREDGVVQNVDTNTLVVRRGIAHHDGYVRFDDFFLSAGEGVGDTLVTEGARRRITVNVYERDASARRRCIQRWGVHCNVCGFNFAARYGEVGEGFIHVHHLVKVSAVGSEYQLNPEVDLRPVCANCHSMLHRRDPPLTIEELRVRLHECVCFLPSSGSAGRVSDVAESDARLGSPGSRITALPEDDEREKET